MLWFIIALIAFILNFGAVILDLTFLGIDQFTVLPLIGMILALTAMLLLRKGGD